MIKHTVLVIGAGANKEINEGCGLGIDLLREISERVTDRTSKGKEYLSRAFKQLPHLNELIRERFLHHLELFRKDKNNSIDAFIYEVENYPEYKEFSEAYQDIARVLIFAHVLGWEGHRIPDGKGKVGKTFQNILDEKLKKRTWFSVLANYLNEYDLLDSDRLKIITFNYDRILEAFLLESFKPNDAIRKFINTNITHIYGRIGSLPELEKKNLPSGDPEGEIEFGHPNHDFEKIAQVKDNIFLIHNKIDEQIIKNIMRRAEKLLVFGYGFDALNNKRLMLSNSLLSDKIAFNVYSGVINDFDFSQRRKTTEFIRHFARKSEIKFLPTVEFVRWGLNDFLKTAN